jgi:hypothetical protein
VHAAWIPPAIRALDAWAESKGVTAGIRANSIDEAIEIQQSRAAPDERHWGELLDLGTRQQALDFAPDESVSIALERIVKGVEMRLPGDVRLADGGGHARGEMRIRWFDAAAGRTYHEHALTKAADAAKLRALLGDRRIDASEHPAELPPLATLVPYHPHDAYPADERPVFFGHYALFDAADRGFGKVLRANVACVDHGGGFAAGALSAYRWNGERELTRASVVTVAATAD